MYSRFQATLYISSKKQVISVLFNTAKVWHPLYISRWSRIILQSYFTCRIYVHIFHSYMLTNNALLAIYTLLFFMFVLVFIIITTIMFTLIYETSFIADFLTLLAEEDITLFSH